MFTPRLEMLNLSSIATSLWILESTALNTPCAYELIVIKIQCLLHAFKVSLSQACRLSHREKNPNACSSTTLRYAGTDDKQTGRTFYHERSAACAPFSSSSRHISLCFGDVNDSAVPPRLFLAAMFAPLSNSSFTVLK